MPDRPEAAGTTVIRAYRAEDLDPLLRLFQRAVHELAADDYDAAQLAAWAPPEPDRAAWAQRLGSGSTFVAVHGDAIAGFVRVATGDQEGDGTIDLLYVDPGLAGRGIGRRLLAHALSVLREAGVTRAWAAASHTARPLFARLGFRTIARQSVQRNGVEIDNWSMVCDLGEA